MERHWRHQPWRAGGKTFTAVNLAASPSHGCDAIRAVGRCNLRHPSVHQMFDLGECQGLADYLLDDVPINNCWCIPALADLFAARRTSRLALGGNPDLPEMVAWSTV